MSYFSNFDTVQYDIEGNGVYRKLTDITQYSTIITKNLDNVAFYSYYNIQDGERPDTVSQNLYDTPEYYWTLFIINPELQNYWHDWPKSSDALREHIEAENIGMAGIFDADDTIAGKFTVGETVTGALSGATATLIAKYPTNGYIQMKMLSGVFRETGESIQGITSGDTIACTAIVKAAYGPSYHIDDGTMERTKRRSAGTSPVTHFEAEYEENLLKSRIKVIKPSKIGQVVSDFKSVMRGS